MAENMKILKTKAGDDGGDDSNDDLADDVTRLVAVIGIRTAVAYGRRKIENGRGKL